MTGVPSSHLPIRMKIALKTGRYNLKIFKNGSSVYVRGCPHLGSGSLPLVNMVIDLSDPIIMQLCSGLEAVMVALDQRENANV